MSQGSFALHKLNPVIFTPMPEDTELSEQLSQHGLFETRRRSADTSTSPGSEEIKLAERFDLHGSNRLQDFSLPHDQQISAQHVVSYKYKLTHSRSEPNFNSRMRGMTSCRTSRCVTGISTESSSRGSHRRSNTCTTFGEQASSMESVLTDAIARVILPCAPHFFFSPAFTSWPSCFHEALSDSAAHGRSANDTSWG